MNFDWSQTVVHKRTQRQSKQMKEKKETVSEIRRDIFVHSNRTPDQISE